MTEYHIPYGKTQLTFQVPDSFHVDVLAPAPLPPALDPLQAVFEALDNPAGGTRLDHFAHARSVAIAINDKTRPVPLAQLLPPLLERLTALGIPDGVITFLISTGTHPPMPPGEFASVVPQEILARYRVLCHDINDRTNLVYAGETSRGTPVWVNRIFANSELRIAVGNLEPHQFMGFSGGVKTAAIGLAGKETIDRNHSLMLDPRAVIARYDDNPMRQDLEELGEIIGVQFALNALVNDKKQIVRVIAGNPRAVMQSCVPHVLELYEVRAAAPFELMITSPGGHPKDINLYQAQKALAHATFVTREGGTVILTAACPEGTGSRAYEDWVIGMPSHEAVLKRFGREGFHIGPHKAFQIARDSVRERVLCVTEMPPVFTQQLLLTRCESLDAALSLALRELSPGAHIGILPYANATIPTLAAPLSQSA